MIAKDLINYWKIGADDAWKTAEELMELKRYHYALFFCHLALEKLLKGLVFEKTDKHAPPIHDLNKIAKQAGLDFSTKQVEDFKEITSWNVEARYDNIKLAFYKKATREFTNLWFKKAKDYYLWLKKQF